AGIVAALLLGTAVSVLFALSEAQQRDLADKARHEAERGAYQARLTAALAALSEHNVVEASRQLAAAPGPLRGGEWQHLQGRLDDSYDAFGNTDENWAPLFTAQGPRAVGIVGGTAELWDADSHTCLGVLARDGPSQVFTAATPAGAHIFLSYQGREVRLVDTSGQVLQSFAVPAADAWLLALAVSPDDSRVAFAWAGAQGFFLFDMASGRLLAHPTEHQGTVRAVDFNH